MDKVIMDEILQLDFHLAEAYKSLRTNIQFCGENIKVISFTSCMPNEGKSVIVIQLAKTMAELGKKVLLLDADIRGSVMTARYNVKGAVHDLAKDETEISYRRQSEIRAIQGLTEYLAGQCELEECVYRSNIEGMDIVFTGVSAPNPSELLGSDKFYEMVQGMREQYDYIFIDCSPLGSVTDAAIVARICDGAVMVIESEAISYKFAQYVKEQLQNSGCKILGAVLNKVSVNGGSYYNKHYKKYYNSYYNNYYGKNRKKK